MPLGTLMEGAPTFFGDMGYKTAAACLSGDLVVVGVCLNVTLDSIVNSLGKSRQELTMGKYRV